MENKDHKHFLDDINWYAQMSGLVHVSNKEQEQSNKLNKDEPAGNNTTAPTSSDKTSEGSK